MDILENLKSYEAKIEQETTRNHSNELILLENAFSHLGLGFTKIENKEFDKVTLVRIGLLAANFNSFTISIDAAKKGYYLQSLSLMRNVYENWLAFWYLIKYPNEVDRWLDPSWEQRPPKADKMLREIDHPLKSTKTTLHELATELHRFSHTDPAMVLNQLEDDGNKLNIRIGQKFDSENFKACVYSIGLWIGMNLDALESLIQDNEDWKKQHNLIKNKITNFMNKYNEQVED
jgi:hypothetical protein